MILTGLALGMICLITAAGNLLVLLAVSCNSHLRGTTHYFIANLAVADLLLGTTVLPFSASLEVIDQWLFGPVMCDLWAAMDVLCCTASILSLCVISVDRSDVLLSLSLTLSVSLSLIYSLSLSVSVGLSLSLSVTLSAQQLALLFSLFVTPSISVFQLPCTASLSPSLYLSPSLSL